MSYYQNSYSVEDTFIDFQGNKYTVVTGGTTPSTPFDSSNIVDDKIVWGDLELEPVEQGTGQGLVNYAVNKQYKVGDIVIYNNKIYKCKTAHKSASEFDSTKWEEISAGGLSTWQQETDYKVNDAVLYQNCLYRCITAHTSTTSFDNTKWVIISGNDGSVNFVKLWEGDASATNAKMNLTDSLDNYDFIYFEGHCATHCVSLIVSIDELKSQLDCVIGTFYTGSYYGQAFVEYVNETTLNMRGVHAGGGWACHILSIYGIKSNAKYSTEEQKIGNWIDGKTLYQITVSDTTGNSGSLKTYDLSEYGIDTVVDISGFFLSASNQTIPIIYYGSSSSYSLCYFETNDSTISCRVYGSAFANRPCYITVKYTKT